MMSFLPPALGTTLWWSYSVLEFVEFPAFTKRHLALAKDRADDILLDIENDLLENPERGPVIEGAAGVRKARVADPSRGKGKSGSREVPPRTESPCAGVAILSCCRGVEAERHSQDSHESWPEPDGICGLPGHQRGVRQKLGTRDAPTS